MRTAGRTPGASLKRCCPQRRPSSPGCHGTCAGEDSTFPDVTARPPRRRRPEEFSRVDLARICFGLHDSPDDGNLPGAGDAYATLLTQIRPLIVRRARTVCRDSNRLGSCSHPRCDGWFCAATEEILIVRLLGPNPRGAEPKLRRFLTTNPNASDDHLIKHVREVINALRWEDVQRQVAKNLGFPGRVDMFVKDSPHRGCLVAVLNDVLSHHSALAQRTGLPTELRVWCVALQADAYQPAHSFPDARRVLRRLARGSSKLRRILDGTEDTDEPDLLGQLETVVVAVDQALGSLNDNQCIRCGGLPKALPEQRLERAAELMKAFASTDSEDDAGRLAAVDRLDMPLTADTAPIFLAVLNGDPWEDSWFDRYVGGPRNCFFLAEPSDQLETEPQQHINDVLSDEQALPPVGPREPNRLDNPGKNPDDGR